jgi:imidazolonepropionase-like amidohydrolase
MRSIFVVISLLMFVACATTRTTQHGPSSSDLLFIKCGRLIDGESDRAFTNVDLIVSGGRIQKSGQGLEIPKGARVVDLSSYTVLPGLIEMHAHLAAHPEESADLKAHMLTSQTQILRTARVHAALMLQLGFTTVRDLGTYHADVTLRLRDEINRGQTQGPRLAVAPFYLTIPGGGGDLNIPNYKGEVPESVRLGVTRGAENFKLKTELAIRQGADVIKVIASGAVLAFGSTPGQVEMTLEEIKAVVETAHRAGIPVAAHAHGRQSIKDAILAGVDTVEHASMIDDEGIRLAKKNGVALSMDIYNGDFIASEGVRLKWPKEFLQKNLRLTEIQRQNFTKSYKAGVAIVYGTDSGIYPWNQTAKQFKIMVDRGMKPMDAIKSATSVAAKYLGWSKNVGSLTPGHFADLIAVREDPLHDIRAIENVAVVIKEGRVIRLP